MFKVLIGVVMIYTSVSGQALERYTSLDKEKFNELWNQFLSSKQVDQTKIGEEDYRATEFSLIEEWGKEQFPRRRDSIPGMDDRDCRWVPFVENKVTLADGTEMSASFINFNWTSDDSYHNFIASQAPLQKNQHLFWKMIWEKGIEQTVMVTEMRDNEIRELCYPYFPESMGQKVQFDDGLQIECVEESRLMPTCKENVQIRLLKVSFEGQERILTHYWYRNWPDQTAPQQTNTLISLIQEVAKDKNAIDSQTPILVHCAGGVGRTGTLIASYHLAQRVEKGASIPRIFDLIAEMRWQRTKVVSRPDQYEFCHKICKDLQEFSALVKP